MYRLQQVLTNSPALFPHFASFYRLPSSLTANDPPAGGQPEYMSTEPRPYCTFNCRVEPVQQEHVRDGTINHGRTQLLVVIPVKPGEQHPVDDMRLSTLGVSGDTLWSWVSKRFEVSAVDVDVTRSVIVVSAEEVAL